MDWKAFELRATSVLHTITELAAPGAAQIFYTKIPADDSRQKEIKAYEKERKKRLPESFRKALLEFAPKFEISWSVAGSDPNLADALGVSMGELSWDYRELAGMEEECRDAVSSGDLDSWENKLPFHRTGGSDMLAIDLSVKDGPVVYLSHDGDDELENIALGKNFLDFIERASRIGFADPESYQYGFVTGDKGLDLKAEASARIRKKLRIG